MSFLKKLFGMGGSESAAAPGQTETYKDFTIVPHPQKEGGQYRLAGTISKSIDGETRTHSLIRADLFVNKDEAEQVTIRKAKQVIDEQGDRLFK